MTADHAKIHDFSAEHIPLDLNSGELMEIDYALRRRASELASARAALPPADRAAMETRLDDCASLIGTTLNKIEQAKRRLGIPVDPS